MEETDEREITCKRGNEGTEIRDRTQTDHRSVEIIYVAVTDRQTQSVHDAGKSRASDQHRASGL